MDYAEARDAFFQPRAGAAAAEPATPGARLRHAIEPIATVHFWSEPANVGYASLGLDFLSGYVWSRASVLGEPDPAVVASAFGVFEPALVATLYDAGRQACPLADVRAAAVAGAVAGLRGSFAHAGAAVDTTGLPDVVAALRRGIAAADATGRPLFAGAAALPEPGDDLGALWLACTTLREYRGDTHLAACVAHGLTGLQANVLTEALVGWEPGSYTATRGWSAEAIAAATADLRERDLLDGAGALTDTGRTLRAHVEAATENGVAPVLAAIGEDLDDVVARCTAWSAAVVGRGWFPPDPFKRASG